MPPPFGRGSWPCSRRPSHDYNGSVARRRRRGEGSVFFDHDAGTWVAVVSLGVINGKRIRRKVRATSERAALRERERLLDSHGRGIYPATGTLDAYLSEWLPAHARSIRQSTADSYATHIKLWISPLLGGILLARLRPADVRRLIGHMEAKGKSAGYIHLVIRTLSAALTAASNDRIVADVATRGVRLPRIEREPVHALTDVERDAIVDATKDTWVERPVRVWLGSGLRRGEVLGLDQGDVLAGFVRVRVSKTRIRAVPITSDAEAALREAIAAAPRRGPREPIFYGERTGDRLRGDSITHALPRILERAGLGHHAPHFLRHGVATLMLTDGHSIKTIADQLGNSPAIVAKTYAHVVPDAQRAAVNSLERRSG